MPANAQKSAQKEITQPSHSDHPDHPHLHHEDESEFLEIDRRPPIPIDLRNIPLDRLPPGPLSRANIQQWFEVLQELHGGELPKDVRKLQEAIHELEAIRQAAVDKQQVIRQRPPERSAPKPPASTK